MIQIIRNADLYAPEPLGRRDLLTSAGRIIWIGETAPTLPPELSVEAVDAGGRRLIPGLIDGHVHVTGGGGESGPASRVPPLAISDFTCHGVTTVVGLLGMDDVTRDTAALLATVRGLVDLGLGAWCLTGGYHLPLTTVTGSARGDIVHIDRVIGVGELALSDHRSSQPTLDELLRIASEAHTAGILTGKAGIVHFHMGDGARGLELINRALDVSELPARVFNPTHVNRRRDLFAEALLLAARGAVIDITAFPVTDDEDAWSAPAALGRYLDRGLPPGNVTVSSDSGGSLPVYDESGRVVSCDVGRPDSLLASLAELVGSGRALATVLPAYTSNPARLLRLGDRGRIAVGTSADLVILTTDGRASDVMVGGRWHVRDGQAIVRGPYEAVGT